MVLEFVLDLSFPDCAQDVLNIFTDNDDTGESNRVRADNLASFSNLNTFPSRHNTSVFKTGIWKIPYLILLAQLHYW
jgi:hypothetical protein